MKNKCLTIFLLSILFNQHVVHASDDPAEIAIGERLFLETRFAQAFYANAKKSDPVMDYTLTTEQPLKSPYAGKTMNCRACHMVDEHKDTQFGMRSYADYAKRPPVPARADNAKTSGRNSMSMVNIAIAHQSQRSALFHFDGEFNSMEDLIRATLTGRNFGWLIGEDKAAIQHVANVIRKDTGNGELAQEFGGAYSEVLKGTSTKLPTKFKLPKDYRIDVNLASDRQIFDTVAKLISAYVLNLNFQKNKEGLYDGSPYDAFLKKNNLPRKAEKNESNQTYSARLLKMINDLDNLKFIHASDKKFSTHKQDFVFSKKELKGLKLFFSEGSNNKSGGNCVSCHSAPHFSDFGFHNTGLVQQNYDALHGSGSFNKLFIPDLVKRNKNYNAYLPATVKHPQANSRFRTIMSKNKPGYADLGLWNVFANPDMPAPQSKLKNIMCEQTAKSNKNKCDNNLLTNKTIAAFKTPVLRNLGHSAPYMHTGQALNLNQVIKLYITSSILIKSNSLRNPEEKIRNINLIDKDIVPLTAFLKSLNEDYD